MLPGRTENAVKIRWKSLNRQSNRPRSANAVNQVLDGASGASTDSSSRRGRGSRRPPASVRASTLTAGASETTTAPCAPLVISSSQSFTAPMNLQGGSSAAPVGFYDGGAPGAQTAHLAVEAPQGPTPYSASNGAHVACSSGSMATVSSTSGPAGLGGPAIASQPLTSTQQQQLLHGQDSFRSVQSVASVGSLGSLLMRHPSRSEVRVYDRVPSGTSDVWPADPRIEERFMTHGASLRSLLASPLQGNGSHGQQPQHELNELYDIIDEHIHTDFDDK